MKEQMRIFNSNDLYERVKDVSDNHNEATCDLLIKILSSVGLSIVDTEEATEIIDFQKRAEDNGK